MSVGEDAVWLVYMIRCDDDSLYTGITTDMARRWNEHSSWNENSSWNERSGWSEHDSSSERNNEEKIDRLHGGRCKDAVGVAENSPSTTKLNRGAKFFRGRKPLQLAYIESGHNRSSASRREAAIKQLSRAAKLQLLTADRNELHTLDRALLPMLDL